MTTLQNKTGNAACPRCGKANGCCFGTDTPCWCASADMERAKPAPDAQACYCSACLEQVIAEQRRSVT